MDRSLFFYSVKKGIGRGVVDVNAPGFKCSVRTPGSFSYQGDNPVTLYGESSRFADFPSVTTPAGTCDARQKEDGYGPLVWIPIGRASISVAYGNGYVMIPSYSLPCRFIITGLLNSSLHRLRQPVKSTHGKITVSSLQSCCLQHKALPSKLNQT
ncbi:hypothetical protein XENOCAPTIV_029974 [Xenoophorus captivus]|uniref:Uncharacterized protein n=1 Tax=Xenoophorus captivus TaxID=1517983 RepID=A0ABV0QD20_9TELE